MGYSLRDRLGRSQAPAEDTSAAGTNRDTAGHFVGHDPGQGGILRDSCWFLLRPFIASVHSLNGMSEQRKPTLYFDDALFWSKLALKGVRRLKAAAAVVDLSESYLGQITRGAVPPAETRAKIAAALGVDESALWKPISAGAAA